jgi:uncharacterized FAD-dependent dehydrogenase
LTTELQLNVPPATAADSEQLKKAAAKALHVREHEISAIEVLRRSVDARRGKPQLQLKLMIYGDGELPKPAPSRFDYQYVKEKPPVIIVGAGPAGLFAALRLLEKGLRPVILERGKSVNERKYDMVHLAREQEVNPDSNWCFGEGGAGTYSDGKLYTRSNKRGNIHDVLEQLVHHGANPDILIDAHAHIGTDKLPHIMANIRQTITAHGGEYYFNTRIVNFLMKDKRVTGVEDRHGNRHEGIAVILAAGHSARDMYELFHQQQWALEAKPFAMGVRAEHPQQLINEIQYHGKDYSPLLPAASYSLVTQVKHRGVFSFCMCPGGSMVPAATSNGEVVVNGMSNSQRNSAYANAGIVVQIDPEELSEYQKYGALAGLRFQQDIEQSMCLTKKLTHLDKHNNIHDIRNLTAPAQRMTDFIQRKTSSRLPKTSYIPGVASAPLHELLPDIISNNLSEAFRHFERKMCGYLTDEAILVAVESRTSSPVRIPRNKETLEHTGLAGLYPCGEGAGYAGGITSSAIDGINCADRIAYNKQ